MVTTTNNTAMDDVMTCPITGENMKDPVIDHEGNSYEKKAIMEWLKKNSTSPITRNPLRLNQLSPNRALKNLIEKIGEKNLKSGIIPQATAPLPKQLTLPSSNGGGKPRKGFLAKAFSFKKDKKNGNNVEGLKISDIFGGKKTKANDYPPSAEIELLQAEIDKNTGTGIISLRVSEDEKERHNPSKIVCAIDVSYSMDDPAIMHNDTEGSSGLTLLDIVKHATVTLIESLGPSDEIALVCYATQATVVLPFTLMTSNGKKLAKRAAKDLKTEGTTNLWDGLKTSMELAANHNNTIAAITDGVESRSNSGSSTNIFLLTDGRPNVNPPRGELQTFIRYKESNDIAAAKVSTFGFGYNLESKLLNDIAIVGGGHYCFIPDSSFVGTVFINAAANVLSTAIPSATLSIECDNGVVVNDSFFLIDNDQTCVKTSWGATISLPSLSYGQTFDIAIQLDPKKIKQRKAKSSPFMVSISIMGNDNKGSEVPAVLVDDLTEQICIGKVRAKLVSFIRKSELRFKNIQSIEADMKSAEKDRLTLLALANSYTKRMVSKTNKLNLEALIADIDGQIAEAYSKWMWHEKWGKHYLLSLARAHEMQQCTNFKDLGVQTYVTKKFSLIRDMAENKFCSLPPPNPSRKPKSRPKGFKMIPTINMSAYHNPSAPCFAAGSPVRLAPNGRCVPVEKVMAGDRLYYDGQQEEAIVRCVIVTACDGADLVELEGGVLVTPYHPMCRRNKEGNNEWKFPKDLDVVKRYPDCRWVYNFVLDGSGTMQMGSVYDAVALGHGIEGDAVASHAYLGSSDVIRDLSKMKGWDEGRVYLGSNPGIRCPESNLLIKFVQEENEMEIQEQPISQKLLTVW